MFTRKLPITLGVIMIVLLILLIVGWVTLAIYGALSSDSSPGLFWVFLPVGSIFCVLLLVGVSLYLSLSVKAINLNRRQSNFIDSVTHELKSPIASMKLYLQTLNRRNVTAEQQAGFLAAMLEDVERLDHLTNQMIDAGRVETRPTQGDVEAVAVGPLLQDCAETVCLRYRVDVGVVKLDLQPCVVRARRVDLDMIFRNLIDNAVKYAGQQPQVEVVCRALDDGRITVGVADNGRGIPPKMRRKIFGRFVRLGLELQRDRPGTGLGLYIVRTLVLGLRGRIHVHDRDGTSGTVFEVILPGEGVTDE
jgi:signal transduction histidine kinase